MRTIRLTMAQALLRFLDAQYVELDGYEHKFVHGVMGIFGHGNVTGLGEALEYGDSSLRFIQGNNEQGLVHAATAFAKQKNRLGIYACTSSIGPGATNMITGAATATVNRIPVLLLPGDSFSSRQPDPVLQQIETPWDHTINANNAFKPVSRYWDRIERPEQLMVAALNAMRVLTDPVETGAATLCLPQDTQAEAYDYPDYFLAKRIWHLDRRPLNPRSLREATTLLSKARKPLIIAGGGVHYSHASDTLRDFAETFGIPVGETQAGKSAMSWKNSMSVGAIGVTGTSAANLLANEADVVLVVGSRLQDFTTASKQIFSPEVKLLHLNVSQYDGLKMDSIALQADAKFGLESLKDILQTESYQTSLEYRERISELQSEWNVEVDRLYQLNSEEGNVQTLIIGALNKFMSPEDVVLCAAGSLPGDLHRLWRSELPKSYHMEYGYSCMGYEVAGGLGARLAMDKGELYVIVGDGSYLMLHSEILTALKEHVKINVILLDNSGYQCIKNLQMAHGSVGFGNEFRYREKNSDRLIGKITPVDFKKYAEALGVKAFYANNVNEFKELLRTTRKEDVSTLIEVKVLPGTMTDGYHSWWRVGIPEVSNCKATTDSNLKMSEEISKARAY
ncbi:MAG: 3D-(3,5/4)-trihydroxycyclohexane-1,2-dione acylhydrolase (decyclizing) [Proteobacteria bacterium]|nr:MAG: 3D-(3,5/4)-trihydroxycyclohexane-1,2-dione acylhydrolase (decyclizing) [Pseudomonadota bacterium]